MGTHRFAGGASAVIATGLILGGLSSASAAPTVIELTQTGCQFLEIEGGVDHGFETRQAIDCVVINSESGAERLSNVQPLILKPGAYVFRVSNKNVPYQLGFYLRASSRVKIPFFPKVAGGGLNEGDTKDYAIELTPGSYKFSCPLNPTPDYPLIVKE